MRICSEYCHLYQDKLIILILNIFLINYQKCVRIFLITQVWLQPDRSLSTWWLLPAPTSPHQSLPARVEAAKNNCVISFVIFLPFSLSRRSPMFGAFWKPIAKVNQLCFVRHQNRTRFFLSSLGKIRKQFNLNLFFYWDFESFSNDKFFIFCRCLAWRGWETFSRHHPSSANVCANNFNYSRWARNCETLRRLRSACFSSEEREKMKNCARLIKYSRETSSSGIRKSARRVYIILIVFCWSM